MEKTLRIFEDYQEYLDFLRDSTTCTDPIFTANHEKEHLEEAQRLGYRTVYGAYFIGNDFPHPFIAGFVDFPDKLPGKGDLVKILFAPKEPSDDDLEIVRALDV
jgi:hypothetical protein